MIIKLKDSITTQKGVIFPKGYEIPCDALVNLPNGVTTPAMIEPDGTVTPLGLQIGTQDFGKLDILLEYPKQK
jgi:hypothetical protein